MSRLATISGASRPNLDVPPGRVQLFVLGAGDQRRIDISYTRFDLALKYELTDQIEFMLLFNNLTNIDERNSIYNRDTGWKILNTSENYGRTADLGVRFSL